MCDSIKTTGDGKHRKTVFFHWSKTEPVSNCGAGEAYAHSDVFHKQIALLEAWTALRAAKCPRPTRNDHNRQDAKRLQRAARHKFRKIWNLFMFDLGKLISGRRVGKPQLLESVIPGTCTAGQTAKTRALQNTTMTSDERNPCRARRKRPSFFHLSNGPTEFHMTSSASKRIDTPSPHQLHDPS